MVITIYDLRFTIYDLLLSYFPALVLHRGFVTTTPPLFFLKRGGRGVSFFEGMRYKRAPAGEFFLGSGGEFF
jgi:hypothetical protein